ncbi:hypothetical protein ALC60_01911 [Trachymyrmex zeteki]|uniref:Uncharacterized protein n=1 Tax=Mycetomoellerius zeteki TaxID=64791 RepID=A0A151XFB3_9HYME|nr:hypothetical protein ALC60_01911 [Trachymyrmex zeteki]
MYEIEHAIDELTIFYLAPRCSDLGVLGVLGINDSFCSYYFTPPSRQLLRNGLHFEFQITLRDC